MLKTARHALLALLALGVATSGVSRADDSAVLEFLDGGALSTEFSVSLGFLYGAGSRADGLGTPVSTLRSGVGGVSGNPAGLAFLESGGIVLDVLPPLGVSPSSFIDVDARTAEGIDDAIEDIAADGLVPEYPSIDAVVGQRSGVVSGAFAIRLGPIVAGAAVDEPASIHLDFVETGIEAFAQTVKEEGGDDVDIAVRCLLDATANIRLEIDRVTLAAGTRVGDAFGLGASVSRYRAAGSVSGVVRADGIIDYGGQEYAFNDPSDPWPNRLDQSIEGSYEGDAIGWTAGATWRATDFLTLDVAYASGPEIRLDGSLTAIENTLPGLEDGEFDADAISASQPTLTETEETVEELPLTIAFPSYLGAAVSLRAGPVLTSIEYRRYDGAFSYDYDGRTEGIEVSDGLGLAVDFGAVWLGGGVLRGEIVGDDVEKDGTGEILAPVASCGFGIGLAENVTLESLVLALPLQVMRVSIGYSF